MLYALALEGQAPAVFGKLSKRHVPVAGVHASAAVMLIGVALNYVVPKEVFTWVTSVSLIGTLWTWIIIMYSHIKYRQAVEQKRVRAVSFRMPVSPLANWAVIIFLLIVAVSFSRDADTRVALYVAPVWFGLLAAGYTLRQKRP